MGEQDGAACRFQSYAGKALDLADKRADYAVARASGARFGGSSALVGQRGASWLTTDRGSHCLRGRAGPLAPTASREFTAPGEVAYRLRSDLGSVGAHYKAKTFGGEK